MRKKSLSVWVGSAPQMGPFLSLNFFIYKVGLIPTHRVNEVSMGDSWHQAWHRLGTQ